MDMHFVMFLVEKNEKKKFENTWKQVITGLGCMHSSELPKKNSHNNLSNHCASKDTMRILGMCASKQVSQISL